MNTFLIYSIHCLWLGHNSSSYSRYTQTTR